MGDDMNKDRIDKGMWWDRAWSLIEGCTPVSAGCEHCWSAAATNMRAKQTNPKIRARYEGLTNDDGCFNGKIRLMHESLELPLHVKKPTTWAIWNDLFHENVPFEFIDKVFAIAAMCPQHTFQILTKRPERMLEYLTTRPNPREVVDRRDAIVITMNSHYELSHQRYWVIDTWPLPNVWLGVTAENQATADERIPLLLQCPAAVRFVSIEPMLGPVDLFDFVHNEPADSDSPPPLDWVIVGGETGPGARPMDPAWVREIRNLCREKCINVPFFFKHWGEWVFNDDSCVFSFSRLGKKVAGRLLDGREWSEMPIQTGTGD